MPHKGNKPYPRIPKIVMSFDTRMRERFVRLHGEGDPQQADLYRCLTCSRLVTWRKIRAGELCCMGRLCKTNPTWLERIRLIAFPWSL